MAEASHARSSRVAIVHHLSLNELRSVSSAAVHEAQKRQFGARIAATELEVWQSSPRPKLYDRTSDAESLDALEHPFAFRI
jgi:hypothetical protein